MATRLNKMEFMPHMRGMHAGSLELGHLRLLDAIRRTGSVSKASAEIGLTQSAASHALARLRQVMDDQLFVRTPRAMVPTAYGEHVCNVAGEALRVLNDGLSVARSFDPMTTTKSFRLYMSDVGQLVMLPPLLARLRSEAPNARLQVERPPAVDTGRAMERGEVHLAIGHIQSLAEGFRQRTLFQERYVCVASAANLRFRQGMTLEAFASSPHAVADNSGMAHWLIDEALLKHGVARRTGLLVPDFITLPFLIEGTDLLVTMPSRLARLFAGMMAIKVMPPPVSVPPYPIRVFWHERAHRDPAVQWLRKTLAALFSSAPPATVA